MLNADDPRVAAFAEVHPGRAVTYGLSERRQVRAEDVEFGAEGIALPRRSAWILKPPCPARHAVMNLLAALAVAGVFGIAPSACAGRVARLPARQDARRAHPSQRHR